MGHQRIHFEGGLTEGWQVGPGRQLEAQLGLLAGGLGSPPRGCYTWLGWLLPNWWSQGS